MEKSCIKNKTEKIEASLVKQKGLSSLINGVPESPPEEGCRGYKSWTAFGYEYDCAYESELSCDECKYGQGKKDPAAKCN